MSTKKKIFDCDEGEVEFVMFHPKGKNYLLCGLADGNLYFYNIKDGNFKILAGPNGVACKTGSFLNQGKEFLAVYEVIFKLLKYTIRNSNFEFKKFFL